MKTARSRPACAASTLWVLAPVVLCVACSRGDDPAVVQARAALTMAENDARAANATLEAAEAELQHAEAAVAAADQEPQLVQARAQLARVGAVQAELHAERARWGNDNRVDSGGRYLRWQELPRIDQQMMRQGGEVVRHRNAVGRLEAPLRAAQQNARHAGARVAQAREEVRRKDAAVARAREVLAATVAAAEG